MLRTKLLFLAIACIGVSAWADKYADQVYSKIKDIRHPTLKDYKKIQKYLSKGERPFIDRLDGWQYKEKAREFRFIGRNPEESIESLLIMNTPNASNNSSKESEIRLSRDTSSTMLADGPM
jgi:hypothetical protein